jgi:hypothetical protein
MNVCMYVLRVESRASSMLSTHFKSELETSLLLVCFLETGSHYVVQTGLKFMIHLPHPPKC